MSHVFDRDYFHGGAKVGGYAHEGYQDFAAHWLTVKKILELKPDSVLEIGAARGYVLRRLEDAGVRVCGLEISEHCFLTRAVEDIVTWDVTKAPWPIEDKAFDLGLSVAFLEHVPEDKLPIVFSELARTCKRGLHGIDLHDDDHFDKTHCTIRPLRYWLARLPEGHVGVDKEDLERGDALAAIPPGAPGVKLNIGSFTTQFHQGWRNFDILDLSEWSKARGFKFSQLDVRNGIPFDDGVADLIFSSHMLEHLSYDEGAKFLAECRRVLRPAGVLRVLVPDADRLIDRYRDHHPGTQGQCGLGLYDELSPTASARPTAAGKLYELLCAEHHAIYDWTTLRRMLETAGFTNIRRAQFRRSLSTVMQHETTDLYPELSLIVEAAP